jgi:hypothetical protein
MLKELKITEIVAGTAIVRTWPDTRQCRRTSCRLVPGGGRWGSRPG